MTDKPYKPSNRTLEVLYWMHTHPELGITTHTFSGGGQSRDWVVRGKPGRAHREDGYPGLPEIHSAALTGDLYRSGWIEHDPEEKKETDRSWYDQPYFMTERGHAYVETRMDDIAEMFRQREEARNKVDRLIIVGNNHRYGGSEHGSKYRRRYVTLCRVVRETAKRFYVVIVKNWDGPDTGWRSNFTIQGHGDNRYVEREAVVLDPATEEVFDRLVVTESEIRDDYNEICDQEEAELDAVRKRYKQRRDQQGARFDRMLAEAKGE